MKIRAILLCPMAWHKLGTNLPPLIVPQFKGVYLLFPVVKSGIAKLATARHGEHCLAGGSRLASADYRLVLRPPGPGGLHFRTSLA